MPFPIAHQIVLFIEERTCSCGATTIAASAEPRAQVKSPTGIQGLPLKDCIIPDDCPRAIKRLERKITCCPNCFLFKKLHGANPLDAASHEGNLSRAGRKRPSTKPQGRRLTDDELVDLIS